MVFNWRKSRHGGESRHYQCDHKTVGLKYTLAGTVVEGFFEALGYEVSKLDRSVFAGLDKKDLSRGQWRFLKPEEVVRLKHFK